MRWRAAALIAALGCLSTARAGQNPPAPSSGGNVVFSVSETLIQVDAEVTDRQGHHVTRLKPADFEVLLNHRPQQITNVSYIPLDSPEINKPALSASGPLPSFVVRPQDVHRSTVLLVDDLGLSFESTYYVKRTLHEYIDRNMRPGDLFALWETGRFNSVFQQFTSDKHVLEAAIDNLKWDPNATGLLGAFGENARHGNGPELSNTPVRMRDPGERDEDSYLRASLAGAVFSTMSELVDELREVGGRKAVVLFSDGIDIGSLPNINGNLSLEDPYAQAALKQERQLIDSANRSGTVFYAVDMRGLEYRGARTGQKLFAAQAGLQGLTEPTGGFAVVNSNGYLNGLEQINDDQNGYYLIAFKAPPGIKTTPSKSTPFVDLQVRIKQSGLRVRSRAGFWGETDQAAKSQISPNLQAQLALSSLFNRSDIGVRLTAFYTRTSEGKPAVRNLIYLNATDLKFATGANGKHKTLLHVRVTASGAGTKALANLDRNVEINVNDEQLQRLQRDGILLLLDVPANQPGAYQVRASVREDSSKRIGSAGQYLDIPDLKKDHLALTTPLIDDASVPRGERFRDPSAALREFYPGSELTFVSVIAMDKNAPLDGDLKGAVELYRDDKLVLKSPVAVVPVEGESVHALSGQVKLNDGLPPGQYYLKTTATGHDGNRLRTAAAWMDFEVLPLQGRD